MRLLRAPLVLILFTARCCRHPRFAALVFRITAADFHHERFAAYLKRAGLVRGQCSGCRPRFGELDECVCLICHSDGGQKTE